MQSILQILKVNEIKEGKAKATGNEYRLQDCECVLLDEKGDVGEVGVLSLPRDWIGNVKPGIYLGSFALRANKGREGGRRIEAVLTALNAHPGFKRAAG
jgi:hypothetical protein